MKLVIVTGVSGAGKSQAIKMVQKFTKTEQFF